MHMNYGDWVGGSQRSATVFDVSCYQDHSRRLSQSAQVQLGR